MDYYYSVIVDVIAYFSSILTYLLTTSYQKRVVSKEKELEFYKVKTENLTAEREILTAEEKSLREMLREQLETCKIENERLDKEMENLKRRLLTVEQELKAWELGLKVPKGFELIQLDTYETEVD
jgi:chromosome segregation ATPase